MIIVILVFEMETENVNKWVGVCRLCLNRKDNLVKLFEPIDITKQSWADLISYVLDVKVTTRDDLPDNACKSCLGKVKFAVPFKKKCMTSNTQLKEVPFHSTALEAEENVTKLSNEQHGESRKSKATTYYNKNKGKKEKCRLCLKEEYSNFSLFENAPAQDVTLNEIVSFTLGIKASEQDELPKSICSICAGKLYVLNGFKKQYLDSSRILFLSSEPEIKSEEDLEVTINSDGDLPENNYEVIVKLENCEGRSYNNPTDSVMNIQPNCECRPISCVNHQPSCIRHNPLDVDIQLSKQLATVNYNHPLCMDLQLAGLDVQTTSTNVPKKNRVVKRILLQEKKVPMMVDELPIWNRNERSYQCGVCAKYFLKKGPAVQHVKTHFNGNLLVLYSMKKKKKKCVGQQPAKPYMCTFCSNVYKSKGSLRAHLVIHDKKMFSCHECSSQFHKKQNLKIHMSMHSDEKPYACKSCPKRFKTRTVLRAHENRHNGKRHFLCDKCPKLFYTRHSLIRHTLSHTGEKPHRCPICSRSFSLKINLDYHMRTHTGEKPYTCAHCLRSFSMKCALGEHTKIHTGERPFPCGSCTKSFKSVSALRKHEGTHMKADHKCSVCFQCFPRKNLLQSHKLVHSEGK